MDQIEYRLSTESDIAALADLRWRLKMEDGETTDQSAYDRYVKEYRERLGSDFRAGEVVHWVAVDKDRLVANMSVIIVTKIPAPGRPHAQWGYLTNCYARPEVRNRGVGGGLLGAVKSWAKSEQLEMLTVWPSDDAYSFYQRAGFKRPPDPLVLDLM